MTSKVDESGQEKIAGFLMALLDNPKLLEATESSNLNYTINSLSMQDLVTEIVKLSPSQSGSLQAPASVQTLRSKMPVVDIDEYSKVWKFFDRCTELKNGLMTFFY